MKTSLKSFYRKPKHRFDMGIVKSEKRVVADIYNGNMFPEIVLIFREAYKKSIGHVKSQSKLTCLKLCPYG